MGFSLLSFAGKKPKMSLRTCISVYPEMLLCPRNLLQQIAGQYCLTALI